MLVYKNGMLGMQTLFYFYGSVLPRAAVPSAISALVSLLIIIFMPDSTIVGLFDKPLPFQTFAGVIAFAVVYRINDGYQRYMNVRTAVQTMTSKWCDALTDALVFEEGDGARPSSMGMSAADEAQAQKVRRHFQALLLHRASLLTALALQYLRRDNMLLNLASAGPGGDTKRRSMLRMALATHFKPLPVLGGVTEKELKLLRASEDRVASMFAIVNFTIT